MKIPSQLFNQIRESWSSIDQRVEFILHHSGDDSHLETFRSFLSDLPSLHTHFSIHESIEKDTDIHFTISVDGEDKGIAFQGIPMGHELTSFVLAPLVATGKAKMPDARTVRRIQALRGSIHLKSYVSLSCENCPGVVQALNIFAALNPNIKHTMIEGGLFQELVKEMGILSVPTVTLNDQPFSTGRQDMSQLLNKLEEEVASESEDQVTEEELSYDVVVIGGGPAGISAAIYTARKGLKTALVSENIGGLVKETKGIENLISTPYIEGPELAQKLRHHLDDYPVEVIENQRIEMMEHDDKGKVLSLKGGLKIRTPIVIAATGARWRELNIPGEKEYLGRGVAFCPHCDGPFYKGKEIVVVGGGNSGAEAALDLAGICQKVTLLERNGSLKADQILVDKLKARSNIEIKTNARSVSIEGDGQQVTKLQLQIEDQTYDQDIAGIFIQIGLVPNSSWIADHVELSEFQEIKIDERCATSTAGIFACGDVTTVPYKQIVVAMGEGAKAGLSAFEYYIKHVS